MRANKFTILFVLFLIHQSAVLADEIYMKNGILYKNVIVVDTTGTKVNIIRDNIKMDLKLGLIEKIDIKEYIPNQKSTREIYSQSKYEEFIQRAQKQNEDFHSKDGRGGR